MEKIKVLIVDDEPLLRRVLKSKVDWDLFDMTVAGEAINGEEALLYLDKTPVDLVITDIKMPYMDGNAFINEAGKKFPGTRFFVLSAHSDFSIVRNSFKAGAFDYMLKADINTPVMTDILKKISGDIFKIKYADGCFINVFAIGLSKEDFDVIMAAKESFAETMATKQDDLMVENGMFLLVNRHMIKDIESVKSHNQEYIKVIKEVLHGKGINEFDLGISDTGRSADIDKLILKARVACESNFFSDSNIQYFKKVISSDSKENLNIVAMKKIVMEHIKKLEIKRIRSCFDELFKEAYESIIDKNDFIDSILDFYIYVLNHLSDIDLLPEDIVIDSIEVHSKVKEINRSHKFEKWIFDNIFKIEEFYTQNMYQEFVKMVTLYVDLNIEGEISLKQVAKHFNLSGSYLCNKFSKSANITLLEYIARRKADIAKNYLLNTNYMVKEISTLLGYKNSEHFSRKFKQVVGSSPNEFRVSNNDLIRGEQF